MPQDQPRLVIMVRGRGGLRVAVHSWSVDAGRGTFMVDMSVESRSIYIRTLESRIGVRSSQESHHKTRYTR